jgi:hypothetical protein
MPDGRKTGDVASECILPFNVRVDELGDNMKRKRWVGVQTLKDKEWVEDTFKTKIEATDNKAYVDYQKSLAKLVANVSPWKGVSLTNQALESDDSDMVLFREVEFAPQRKFPEGRYVVQCGNKILQISNRLPIQTVDNQWNYTLTDFHYNYVPGRFWSDAPVSDLISPQNIINEIDQALSINRKGMGRPKVITPGDVGLKLIGIGGHGFVSLSYNPIMGAKPSFEQGTPLPQQVLEERLLQKQQIQDMSGDPKNVLKGQQPSANASGVLTDILRETAERGKYPDIDRFNRSLTRVYKKRILLAQEIMTEERLLKVTGKGNKVKIMKFKASDLRGNTDVRLELDSGLIATKSGQAQMLLNMIQSGFFQDDTVSPTVRQEVFQRMGMTSFSDETNVDVERAEEENSALASGSQDVMTFTQDPETGEPVPVTDDPLFAIDIHPVHYEVHRKYILSPEFKELPVEFQAVAVKHAEAHQMQMESAPPDIREFVQYDKLLPLLKPSGRAMLLAQMGIVEDPSETEAGVPTSDVVVKSKEKIMQTELKEANKMKQFQVTAAQKNREMNIDLLKHGMTEGNKERALQQSKSSGTGK